MHMVVVAVSRVFVVSRVCRAGLGHLELLSLRCHTQYVQHNTVSLRCRWGFRWKGAVLYAGLATRNRVSSRCRSFFVDAAAFAFRSFVAQNQVSLRCRRGFGWHGAVLYACSATRTANALGCNRRVKIYRAGAMLGYMWPVLWIMLGCR